MGPGFAGVSNLGLTWGLPYWISMMLDAVSGSTAD